MMCIWKVWSLQIKQKLCTYYNVTSCIEKSLQFLIAYGVSRVLSSRRLKIIAIGAISLMKKYVKFILFYFGFNYFNICMFFTFLKSSHLEIYIFLNNKCLCSYFWGVIFEGQLRTFSSFSLVLLCASHWCQISPRSGHFGFALLYALQSA